jgi:hypothetical protein
MRRIRRREECENEQKEGRKKRTRRIVGSMATEV